MAKKDEVKYEIKQVEVHKKMSEMRKRTYDRNGKDDRQGNTAVPT